MSWRRASVGLAIVCAFADGTGLAAQVVRGRAIDASSRRPIVGVAVSAEDASGALIATSLTDSVGRFFLGVTDPGDYVIRALHIGYQEVASRPLVLLVGDVIVMEIRLDERAIPIDPIVVTERQRFDIGALQNFYTRMDRMQAAGLGQFITRSQIESRSPNQITDMLQMMHGIFTVPINGRPTSDAVLMRKGGSPCVPALFIDGVRLMRTLGTVELYSIDDYVAPADVEGVEIYRGFSEMPGDLHDDSGCGVVSVYTRRGIREGRKNTTTRTLLAIGVSLLSLGMIVFH